MTAKKGAIRVGTSGYQYDHWKGRFYPEDLKKTEWFSFYAQHFDTVEINNTFYNLPKPETFDHWRDQTPKGFCHALKYSRYGTHMKRLKDPEGHIQKFLDNAKRLKSYLGPILVQLPPHWGADPDRLDAFLDQAPRRHRWAIEFRDEDWFREEVYDVLRRHNAAMCIHDMIESHPREITADWVYVRYHGDHYQGSYSPQALTAQARYIKEWLSGGLDVYAYFNNDENAHAVHNALDLLRYVKD